MDKSENQKQKLEIETKFNEWFEELEGYSMRYERFWDDFDYAKDSKDNRNMVEWLRSAFQVGYEQGYQQNNHTTIIQQMDHNLMEKTNG